MINFRFFDLICRSQFFRIFGGLGPRSYRIFGDYGNHHMGLSRCSNNKVRKLGIRIFVQKIIYLFYYRDVRVRNRHNLGFNRPIFFDRNKYFHYFFRAEDLIQIGVPLKEWFPRFGRALWRAFIFMMLLQLALTPLTLLVFYIMEVYGVTFTWFQAVVFKGIWGATLVSQQYSI